MFTNYNNLNTINKKASNLFREHSRAFLDNYISDNINSGFYAEKSTRSVYDALNMDFDALEMNDFG